MLSTTMLLTIFQYDHDTNNRLIDLAANVTSEQWDAPQEAGQRSLHETMFHILAVHEEWLSLCVNEQPVWGIAKFDRYPNAASLRAFSDKIYTTYLPYIESLTEDQLLSSVTAVMPHGVVQSVLIWHMLVHTFYHNAQHRSESAFMLTHYEHSPGFIDFFGYGSWGQG